MNAIDLVGDLRASADARAAAALVAGRCTAQADAPTNEEAATCIQLPFDESSAAVTLPVFGRYQSPLAALGMGDSENDGHPLLQVILGWLITGAAVSLGAPFWFDVLQRLTRYRPG